MKQSWLDLIWETVTTDPILIGLSAATPRKVSLFWQRAPRNAQKPYMVYDLDFKSAGEETELIESGLLTIRLHGFEPTRDRSIQVIQRLKVILNRKKFNTADDAGVGCRLFFLGEGSLPTQEQDILLEEVVFQARGFDRQTLVQWMNDAATS